MLLDSRFKSLQRSLCCFIVGLLGFSAAFSTQYVVGQQILRIVPNQNPQFGIPQVQFQQPTVFPPTRIYQSPITSGPIYQGPVYPQQGPIGPVYRVPQGAIQIVPPIGGTIQTVQPVADRLPQAVQPNQQILDRLADQAAVDAEKISVLERLLEKYKATAAQVQGTPVELEKLKQKNAELMREVESQRDFARKGILTQKAKITELISLVEKTRTQYAESEAKVQMLEKQIAAAGMQDSPDMQKVETLEAQVSGLEAKLQTLTSENQNYAQQLADAKAAMESQPDDTEKMQLRQRSQKLASENQELMQKQEASSLTISKLRGKLTESLERYEVVFKKLVLMESSNQQPNGKKFELDELAVGDPGVFGSKVTKIASERDSGSAPVQTTSFAQPPVDVSSYESKIAQLTRKNRQLADSNAEFEGEIKSLNRQLADFNKQDSEEAAGQASTPLVSNAVRVVDAPVSSQAADDKSGWGILGWLIPFLVVGLGVAFFVVLKEEVQRPRSGKSDRQDD